MPPNHYIDNDRLLELIVAYQGGDRRCEGELGEMFMSLARHICSKYYFEGVEPDDMVGEGVKVCFAKIDRFKPNLGTKPFNYFTTVIINTGKQLWKSSAMFSKLKRDYGEHLRVKQGHRELPDGSGPRWLSV